jgi:uncharacterized cupredoxin-like copper-binding protein
VSRLGANTATTALLLAVLAGAVALPPRAAARQASVSVAVTAGRPSEFRFTLSRRSVRKGAVVFSVVNRGALPHDFKINGRKTPILQPGRSARLRVVFAKAGRYRYLCTVPGHAAAGMTGSLRVT